MASVMAKRSTAVLLHRIAPRSSSVRLLSSDLPKSSTPSTTSTPSKPERKVKRESLLSRLTAFGLDSVVPGERIPVSKIKLPDTVEAASGETKMYLLAFENGIMDPYDVLPIERNGRGTKDNPVLVTSFDNERLVGCLCEEHSSFIRYTKVYKGEPKRCVCGHWLKLVDAPKYWEKIPEEDMMTIKAYRDWKEQQKKEGKSIGSGHH